MTQRPLLQRGATMIEVLVALVITVIGLLGLIALQGRAYTAESESYQRAQAAILLEDMANRMRSNLTQINSYVGNNIGVGAVEDCDGLASLAERDLCEWGNLLRGVAETNDGTNIGAMRSARACITNPATDVYVIAVVWLGMTPTGPASTVCGQGQYGAENEDLRRAVTTVIRVADLGT